MSCTVTDLKEKQVVCIKSGIFLGCVGDVEVDICSGKIVNIVINGRPKIFGLFGKTDDTVLPWECIEVIGRDVMLVDYEPRIPLKKNKKSIFSALFTNNYTN